MSITEKSFVLNNLCHLTSYPFVKTTNGKNIGITFAKKRDLSENSTQQENIFPLKVSNPILARSVVAVLGLGFIDAGYDFRNQSFSSFCTVSYFFFVRDYHYISKCIKIWMFRYSGDWSRIGVISKENEDLLKFAAFIVVPLCIFLIFSLSKESEDWFFFFFILLGFLKISMCNASDDLFKLLLAN